MISRIAEILKTGQPGQTLEVAGWVRTRRDSKQGFSFVELNDGSCLANLQIVIGCRRARAMSPTSKQADHRRQPATSPAS